MRVMAANDNDNDNGSGIGSALFGLAQAVVGASLVLKGLRHAGVLHQRPSLLLGQLSSPSRRPGNGNVVHRVQNMNPSDLEGSARLIIDLIKKDSLTAEVREDALSVLTRKCGDHWCVGEKDYNAEVAALWSAIVNVSSPLSMRYVMDHYDTDQFHSNRVLKRWRGSDCDDMCVRLGALLRSVGYPLKLRIIAEQDEEHGSPWSHIYLKVGLPPRAPTKWKALDLAVVPHVQPGWEVPGAEETFRTGKPHGFIARVKDFDV